MDYDYDTIITEEVALEGLDGITLSALWSRLSDRPKFTMTIDEHVKNYFWNLCVDQEEFSFFELPEPRLPLVLFDRFLKGNDEESDFNEDNSPEIYPFAIVDESNVFGSCATFYSRVNITNEIRPKTGCNLSLADVESRWGEKLVIVASNETRRKALLGEQCDPLWFPTQKQYITLERIGRSRYYGELTNGSKSLAQFHTCAKSMFYYRITLLNRGIITKQVHYHKPKDSVQRTVSLLHLKRFYVEHKSRLYLMIEETCKHLLSKPGRMDLFHSIRIRLNIKKKENFIKCIRKIANIRSMTYNEFKAATGGEQGSINRIVKVAILYDNVTLDNLDKILEGADRKDLDEENVDQLENEVEEISLKKPTVPNTTLFPKLSVPDTSNQVIDRPTLSQVYAEFNRIGSEGATMQQMGQLMGFTRLESRLICNNLVRLGLLTILKRDVGKQRESAYISKHFFKNNRQSIFEECAKMKNFAASSKMEVSIEANEEPLEIENEGNIPNISSDVKEGKTATKANRKQQIFTLLEDIELLMDDSSKINTTSMTHRTLKRLNIILHAVRKAKIIDSHVTLYKLILHNESEEGGGRMDLKSFHRLIGRLSKEKLIRLIESTISIGNKDKKIQFICDMSVQHDDPMVISAQEQAKLKFLTSADVSGAENKNTPIHESVTQLRKLYNKVDYEPRIYSLALGRSYGYEPKLIRCQLFHEFLYYLNFGYEGQENLMIPDMVFDVESSSLPKMYYSGAEPSWKMFVSPLPTHYGWNKGWCLMSDVLLRLPLSLLVRLVCFNFQIYGIEDYLNDPVKKHIPISFLPIHLRNQLLPTRKYIFSAYECAQRLYYMGLLSLSPNEHKSKDMIFLYLHKKARVVDTTISRPHYYKTSEDIDYPLRYYHFENYASVQAYWNDLETVCRKTPLSPLHVSADETLTINVEIMEKKVAVVPLIQSDENEKAIDNGIAPGDQRGAGGLDSAFFSHLNRSWNWNQPKAKVYYKSSKKQDKSKHHRNPSALVSVQLKNNAAIPYNNKNRMTRLVVNEQLKGLHQGEVVKKTKRQSRRSIVRHVKARMPKKRKTSKHDEIDKMVLAKARKKRVNWTAKEDSLLLLGKVAYVLMFDKPRNSLSCRWIRDFLHSQNEISKNKTSAACQRRINYMLKNLQTGHYISVYVGEARQDEKIVEQIQDLDTLSPLNDKEIFKKHFDAIMDILMSKFQADSNRPSTPPVQLPNTLAELRKNYQITFAKDYWGKSGNYVDVKSKECILFHVTSTLILSTVAGFTSDEIDLSQDLYDVFKRFPDELLLNAFNLVKSSGVICCRKSKVKRKALKNSPVFGTSAYRLSYRYKNMLRSKYPESCYAEMNDMAQHLSNNAKMIGAQPLPIEIDKEGGYALIIISLAATRKITFNFEIPDEVVSLSDDIIGTKLSTLPSDKGPPTKKTKFDCEILDEVVSLTNIKGAMSSSLTSDEEPLTKKRRIDSEEPPKNKTGVECGELLKSEAKIDSEKAPKVKTRVECEKNEDSNKEEIVNVESTHSKVAFKMASKSSRFALYMLRQQMEDINTKTVQHSQDYLLIKPCTISCKLDAEAEVISPAIPVEFTSKLQEYLSLEKVLISDIVAHYKMLKKSGDEIAVMKKIYDAILTRGELGIRYVELKAWFTPCFSFGCHSTQILLTHLKCMEKSKGILGVGTSVLRYVAHIHATVWQLRTFQFESESKESSSIDFNRDKKTVLILPKVWRRADGTLNVPIYKELIMAVMGRIMSFPGIILDKLYTHLSNILKLMELQELLITLLELKSIKNIDVCRNSKSALFSELPVFETKVNSEEWPKTVSLEAEVEGPQRLAAYLLTIQ